MHHRLRGVCSLSARREGETLSESKPRQSKYKVGVFVNGRSADGSMLFVIVSGHWITTTGVNGNDEGLAVCNEKIPWLFSLFFLFPLPVSFLLFPLFLFSLLS